MDFTSLGVPAPLAAALAARGITEPTEIQREVIPAACTGENRGADGDGQDARLPPARTHAH